MLQSAFLFSGKIYKKVEMSKMKKTSRHFRFFIFGLFFDIHCIKFIQINYSYSSTVATVQAIADLFNIFTRISSLLAIMNNSSYPSPVLHGLRALSQIFLSDCKFLLLSVYVYYEYLLGFSVNAD